MKSHLTSASTTTLTRHPGNLNTAIEARAHPVIASDRANQPQEVPARPQLTLSETPVWKHKLILTGRLDYRSVVELQDEIECLCEEGVAILTIDLRQLDAIDPVGARAIARGGTACKKLGRGFAVVPGSAGIQRALVDAGAESVLAGDPRDPGVLSLAASAASGSARNTSTVMVKNL